MFKLNSQLSTLSGKSRVVVVFVFSCGCLGFLLRKLIQSQKE